ncbi:hypothetical protein HIF96_08555 [Helcococcus kunzii]|uniref:hypothetical protein n=1 Tax=Helcococcus kunzii TaxID=40091 RepID=UPI001C94FCCA|nr:hypothetical protein [Helcococcus kunzii]QZO76325.1 hypothetical protein HIF96_08555 [Helcococcus kunzii]
MFYVKEKMSDVIEISIEINDENVYCICPTCEMEVPIDLAEVLKDGDLFSTQIYCSKCSESSGEDNE